MHDVKLMKIVYTANNIFKESAGYFLLQFGILHDIVEQFSIFDVLHDEKEVLWGFDDLNYGIDTS